MKCRNLKNTISWPQSHALSIATGLGARKSKLWSVDPKTCFFRTNILSPKPQFSRISSSLSSSWRKNMLRRNLKNITFEAHILFLKVWQVSGLYDEMRSFNQENFFFLILNKLLHKKPLYHLYKYFFFLLILNFPMKMMGMTKHQ